MHINFNRVGNTSASSRALSVIALIALFLTALPTSADAGSQNFTSSGTFTVPSGYTSLTVTVNGGGGGGGGGTACCFAATGGTGTAGGLSSFDSSVIGNGGGGGIGGTSPLSHGSSGASGTGSGGDTNTTGGGAAGGAGGNGPQAYGGAGGAGGRALKAYSVGALTPGDSISVVVGARGTGGAGAAGGLAGADGTAGSVSITWTEPSAPTVTTSAASSITETAATLNGSISATNGADATQHGFAYSTNSTFSTGVSTTTLGSKSGTGSFNESISSLNSDTTYYARAYATNSAGTGYGSIQSFATAVPTITITKSTTITGDAAVFGTISKGAGTFVIDHPLDPKNKLLYHSFVESPDVLNIYDGIATLDKNGEATIKLPKYFLALNKDFTYLGTAIGQPMPNLFISKGVHRWFFGLFGRPVIKISGGAPGGRVSWQVTGIRKDPFILAHPIIVEVDKGPGQPADKGEFICPECYAE